MLPARPTDDGLNSCGGLVHVDEDLLDQRPHDAFFEAGVRSWIVPHAGEIARQRPQGGGIPYRCRLGERRLEARQGLLRRA